MYSHTAAAVTSQQLYATVTFFGIITLSYFTHIHPFNGPLSGTTWVSWYQKGKINLDFTEERVSGNGISGPYASLHLVPDR